METPQLQHSSMTLFDDANSFINTNRFYYGYFSTIPNVKELDYLDGTKIRKWLVKDWASKILYLYVHKEYVRKKKEFFYYEAVS